MPPGPACRALKVFSFGHFRFSRLLHAGGRKRNGQRKRSSHCALTLTHAYVGDLTQKIQGTRDTALDDWRLSRLERRCSFDTQYTRAHLRPPLLRNLTSIIKTDAHRRI